MRNSSTRPARVLAAFVFDQVGQRAGRRGERHRDDGSAQFVDFDAVNQTKVDDVDAEFRGR